jgi:hypothetical protein
MSHTPGPWTLGNENNQCCDVEAGQTVISLDRMGQHTMQDVISREEMLANACLITAAPELLASVVEEVEYFDSLMASLDPCDVGLRKASMHHHGPRIARARAAIAKARGTP